MRVVLFVAALLAAVFVDVDHPAGADPSVESVYRDFDLFGNWALDCAQPAAIDNPHVSIAVTESGVVTEDQELGGEFAVNHYDVVSASRQARDRIAIEVLFRAQGGEPQRQKLVLQVRKGTRRTMFNQPDGADIRVKDGIVLARGSKTPILTKCE